MFRSKRTATVCAATYCDMSSLSSNDFETILENNPEFAAIIEKNFETYLNPDGNGPKKRKGSAAATPSHHLSSNAKAEIMGGLRRPSLVQAMERHTPRAGPLPLPSHLVSPRASDGDERSVGRRSSGLRSSGSFMRKLKAMDEYRQMGGSDTGASMPGLVPLFVAKMLAAKKRRRINQAMDIPEDIKAEVLSSQHVPAVDAAASQAPEIQAAIVSEIGSMLSVEPKTRKVSRATMLSPLPNMTACLSEGPLSTPRSPVACLPKLIHSNRSGLSVATGRNIDSFGMRSTTRGESWTFRLHLYLLR